MLKVHPENPHFFMENGFLCMREGHDITALQYVDDLEQAVIPNCVTILGPYCLVNAHNLTTLELHDGIETYAPGSLRSASLVGTVVFHCRKEPFQGRSELRFSFDQARVGIDGIRQAFESTTLNLPFAFEVSDQTMYWAHDVFRVGAFILGRLRDPLCLTTVSQHHFEEYCTVHLKQFFTLFAQKNYQQGYDDLVALSYLNKENMAVALDEAQKVGNVEIAAHLLEIRRSFGSDVMSAYDI